MIPEILGLMLVFEEICRLEIKIIGMNAKDIIGEKIKEY